MSRFPEFLIESNGPIQSLPEARRLPEAVHQNIEIALHAGKVPPAERYVFLVAENEAFLIFVRTLRTDGHGLRWQAHVVGGLPSNIRGPTLRRLCESGLQLGRILNWTVSQHVVFEREVERVLSEVVATPLPEFGLGRRAAFKVGRDALRDGNKEMLLFLAPDWRLLRTVLFQFLDSDDMTGDERDAWTFSTFEPVISTEKAGIKVVGALSSAFETLPAIERETLEQKAFILTADALWKMDAGNAKWRSGSAHRLERPPTAERKSFTQSLSSLLGLPHAPSPAPAKPPPFLPERLLSAAAKFSQRAADLSLLRSEADAYLDRNSTEPLDDSLQRLTSFPNTPSIALACALGTLLDKRLEFDIDEETPVANQIGEQFEKWPFDSRVLFLCLCVKSQAERRPTSTQLAAWVQHVLATVETPGDDMEAIKGPSLHLAFALLGIIGKLNSSEFEFSQRAVAASGRLRLHNAPNVSILYRTVRHVAQTGTPSEQLAGAMTETIGFPGRLRNAVLSDVAVMAIQHETGIDVRGTASDTHRRSPGSDTVTVTSAGEGEPPDAGLLILRRLDKFRQASLSPVQDAEA
ncbi:hypothetical protein I6F30_35170 [Bradyrhizobium sp. NBAIM20]|uniref:hypothetical protein n=1 Tax=unclassified Bradyrhizobium TaxID=2631580 RepID=UPI001CD1C8C2|nr:MULTISPECIES: hypothetical protein [unclassified Bradyrhizobium]MCA1416333.1 hypothetical protein [Bradyrhizobium sp. NBAIM20]MCA1466111.1 hypothetical protein [Bradyrhizobium sp. NBAIM18]